MARPRRFFGVVLARAGLGIVSIAKKVFRGACAPRRLMLKPLDGLPIRLDVLNKAAAAPHRAVRNVYSHRSPIALALKLLVDRGARRARIAETVREQPVCGTLVYLLTYAGGLQALARDPKKELDRPAEPARAKAVVAGVRPSRVIGAFAGRTDVTRYINRIETSRDLDGIQFSDFEQYLAAVCGVRTEFDELTIVFSDLRNRVVARADAV